MSPFFPPFQHSIQITIDDRPIDYLLTLDETGHVYEARPMIFELPEIAQKLFFSSSDETLEQKIRAFSGLCRYILPLTLTGWFERYQKEFADVVQEINKRLDEKGKKWDALYDYAIAGSITSKVLELYCLDGEDRYKQLYLWQRLAMAFPNLKGHTSRYYLLSISKDIPAVAADFLPNVTPFLVGSSKLGAYEALGNIKTEAIKAYLLSELKMPYARAYANHIFKALKGYAPTDTQISNTTIQFYHNSARLRSRSLSILLELLSGYPSSQTKAFAFEILQLNSRYAAVHAARALLKMDIPPQQITDIALPLFSLADPQISEAAFSIFALEELPAAYLPDSNAIIHIIGETLSKRHNSNIIQAIPALAYKTGVYLQPDKICRLLKHEASAVREGIIRLISAAFSKKDVDIRPFVKEDMLKKYLALAGDANHSVALQSISLIGIICSGKKIKAYIPSLLKVYQQKSKASVRLEILKAINSILPMVEYLPQIEPVYLDALKEDDTRFQFEAFKGLRFSPDEDLKKQLIVAYKDHPNLDIRDEANYQFSLPIDTQKPHKKKENEWWDTITKSYSKF